MAKKRYKGWVLTFRGSKVQVIRTIEGKVVLSDVNAQHCARPSLWLTPAEARRLFQKLSGDYRD